MEFNNAVSKQTYKDRYEFNEEGLKGTIKRVSSFLATDDEHKKRIVENMKKGRFFGAGRIMAGAGTGQGLTLNNCYSSNIVPDSMRGIFEKVSDNALVHKLGGGNGNDFSMIRPKNTGTSTGAIASGPVSFMDVFDSQTNTVMVGSRRK